MKRILNLLLLLILVSCTKIEVKENVVVLTTEPIPTDTLFTPTSLPSVTPTRQTSCDPFTTDFCITDGHFILHRPIKAPANDLVDSTYPYGSTANGTREPHHGVEFLNKFGTPVHAAGEGVVIFAGPDAGAIYSPWQDFYGNLVVIKHDNGLFTLYAHLSKLDVDVDQDVQVGDKIGEVGQSGVATGSHLHVEVRHGDGQDYFSTENPELWLMPAKDLLGTLAISVVDEHLQHVHYAEFTVKYYPDITQPPVKSRYGVTYPADMPNGVENAVLGDLPRGSYRIALKHNGQLYERWVDVESGKLTQVVFVIK